MKCVCIFVHVCGVKDIKYISCCISQSKKFKRPRNSVCKIHKEERSQDSKAASEIKSRKSETRVGRGVRRVPEVSSAAPIYFLFLECEVMLVLRVLKGILYLSPLSTEGRRKGERTGEGKRGRRRKGRKEEKEQKLDHDSETAGGAFTPSYPFQTISAYSASGAHVLVK